MSDLVYQIFPDRWLRGRTELKVPAGAWRWQDNPIRFSADPKQLTTHPSDQFTFFGGDLAGVTRSLDHLEDLGVGLLYLTPIFHARSTHRYDAVDYRTIDPILGSRADFEELVAALRGRGMRLALDGVFNHTSEDHAWHLDPVKRKSYYIPRDERRTMTWQGGDTLPKLDTQNPEVVREIEGVLDAWPEADVWRLDAAHLLPQEMLRRLKSRVAPRPIVIEDWQDAGHYFQRGLADGVTNFLFREALRTFFREDASPETLLERLGAFLDRYPRAASAASWNLLDNHDTARFLSLVGRDRLSRALVLLFTLPGSPLLYQGTEIGMDGKSEGQSRTPMIWDRTRWDMGLLDHVRSLARLRREHPVLVEGKFKPLAADNRSRALFFERSTQDARAVIGLDDGYHSFRCLTRGIDLAVGPGEWVVRIEERGREPLELRGS